MRNMRYAQFFLSLVALVSGLAPAASAQGAYPTRPLRLIVGFAAGGPTDIPARLIADKLGDLLGQRVVVENKPAAAGMLATREVLAQPRDGYTLLLCTHFESINVAVYKNPQYKLDDLAPISLIAKYYYGIGLANVVPATDIASFVRYAKTHPGEISYGTQIVQDMIPGRVQFYVAPMIQLLPLAQEKQLKILGVSNTERLKSAPQVATLREQGIDFVRFGWLGICAGAGTPQPIIDLLNRHIATIVAGPEYQASTERGGSIPGSSTHA